MASRHEEQCVKAKGSYTSTRVCDERGDVFSGTPQLAVSRALLALAFSRNQLHRIVWHQARPRAAVPATPTLPSQTGNPENKDIGCLDVATTFCLAKESRCARCTVRAKLRNSRYHHIRELGKSRMVPESSVPGSCILRTMMQPRAKAVGSCVVSSPEEVAITGHAWLEPKTTIPQTHDMPKRTQTMHRVLGRTCTSRVRHRCSRTEVQVAQPHACLGLSASVSLGTQYFVENLMRHQPSKCALRLVHGVLRVSCAQTLTRTGLSLLRTRRHKFSTHSLKVTGSQTTERKSSSGTVSKRVRRRVGTVSHSDSEAELGAANSGSSTLHK